MENEKMLRSNSNDSDCQATLSYDNMDGEDVIMADADMACLAFSFGTPEPKRSTRQKTEMNFIIPSDIDDSNDDEAYINVRISKKRAEMVLAAHLASGSNATTTRPKRFSPPLSSDNCQCSRQQPKLQCQPQYQQQQYHYHHHHHHHYHHPQPYRHCGPTIIYNSKHPPTYHSGMEDHSTFVIDIGHKNFPDVVPLAQHHDHKTNTTLIELGNSSPAKRSPPPSPTTQSIPSTAPLTSKKRAQPATNENDHEGDDQRCNHCDYPSLVFKKQKQLNKKQK